MEDLYGNLENYNEVNALQELKSENTQLKKKLEDYAGSLDKLQKDFDSLSSEFKKLEYNYSSLLKTARAEIERKTQIITNINMEKDMLILSALKNGNKSVLHMKKNISSYNKTNNWDKGNNGSVHKKKIQKTKEVILPSDQNSESVENIRSQKYSTPLSNNVTLENTIQKPEACFRNEQNTKSSKYMNDNTKTSMQHETIPNIAQFRPMDIKSRRKSIPATSVEGDKFGVAEKADSMVKDPRQTKFTKDKEDKKSFLKYDNDGHSSKSSESSSRDERMLGYHRPSRDIHKSRHYKYDYDKHRIHDKYDISQKHMRHSPERYNKKPPRDYYDDNWHRPDFNRIRNREGLDTFHHNSYKEHRAHYEKNNYNEPDKYMHNQERYVSKHKLPYEYDELYAKRPKPSHYDRANEDVRWNDKPIVEHQELTETFEMLQEQYTSCQSPDYVDSEIPDQPIKVIMDTAEIPQEDPRLTTNKYIFRNDNGLASLSTTIGRDIDLKPIDKVNWDMQKVSMPKALIQPPSEELLSKDLCNDLKEPMLQINSDIVSTDLRPLQNEHITKDKQTVNYHEDAPDKVNSTKKHKLSIEIPIQDGLMNYTIPKIKRNNQEVKQDTIIKQKSMEIIDSLCAIGNNTNNGKQCPPCDSGRLPLRNVEKQDKFMSSNLNSGHEPQLFKSSIDKHDKQRVLSTREIVEGDLELSDETSDNTEMQKVLSNNANEKNDNTCNVNVQANAPIYNTHNKYLDQNNIDKLPENYPTNKDKQLQETKLTQYCDKMEDHAECSKKQKIKKKIHKLKDSEHIETVEKKSKGKKDKKDKPQEIKSKFNDLFGESNSLITPDDLGIPASHSQSLAQNTAIYVPIFEDAQDATDLEQNIDVSTSKSKGFDKVNTSSQNKDERREVLGSKIDDISKNPSDVEHCEAKVSNKPVTIIYDNTKLQNVIQENDVATIIISTGIQPDEINTDSRAESLVNAEELLSDDMGRDQDDIHKSQDVIIKALATSTPYKQVHQVDSKLPDSTFISNSTLTNAESADTVVSNRNNTMEPPNEDLPDVRIFVKRRRRMIKAAK